MNGSIIVYSNPATQAFWESGLLGPFSLAMLVFILGLMLGERWVNARYSKFSPQRDKITGIIFGAIVVASIATFYLTSKYM